MATPSDLAGGRQTSSPPWAPCLARVPAVTSRPYSAEGRGDAPEEVQLMRDIDEGARLDLGVALGDPPRQADGVQGEVTLQSRADGMDDEVQKIRFIAGVPTRAGEDHPVGTTGIQDFHTRSTQMAE